MSTLNNAISASASALSAERTRIEVAVSNMANAESTRSANGQPYRRREVVLESQSPFEAGLNHNMTQAAGTLCVTTACLSRRMTRLERALDVRLIRRTTRRASLTPAGAAFRVVAEAVVTEVQDAWRSVDRLPVAG